jgi:hypothetical protein
MNNPSSLRNAKENLNPDQESLSYSHSACEDVNVSGILAMRLKTCNPEPDSSKFTAHLFSHLLRESTAGAQQYPYARSSTLIPACKHAHE